MEIRLVLSSIAFILSVNKALRSQAVLEPVYQRNLNDGAHLRSYAAGAGQPNDGAHLRSYDAGAGQSYDGAPLWSFGTSGARQSLDNSGGVGGGTFQSFGGATASNLREYIPLPANFISCELRSMCGGGLEDGRNQGTTMKPGQSESNKGNFSLAGLQTIIIIIKLI